MQKDINVLNKTFRPFNSHLVVEPHVAPLVMNYDFFCNRSWGRSSKLACVLLLRDIVKGSKSIAAFLAFFVFALASIGRIPT